MSNHCTKSRKNVSSFGIHSRFSLLLQIGSLKNYYLFHHNHISKRSVRDSEEHHNALNAEPEVSESDYEIAVSNMRGDGGAHTMNRTFCVIID